ncbi:MAG: outer membrane protein assembly factor BamE [Sphingomonadaceae bacterium]|uniref:outer membrane protein assembly factor BamE n=1 Tax=Thermaurantiacus sp. TaxID=2820283 RepID=UPI00298F0416|nr:outer membrane protein assembly factor BamE [Thermaurantiacus sp.]MCS6985984.1 outer membrane protein assembly factor BamE [Sphingomonadaceae bacterium]
MRPPALATIALVAGACATIPNNMGYIVDPELVKSVQPGVDTKSSVAKTLGRPTQTGLWDENTWYYVSRLTGQRAFLNPKPKAQNVLVVTFGPDGVVTSVEARALEQVVDISPSRRRTPTLGRDSTLLEDIFGNIGQVGGLAPTAGGPPQ